MDVANYRLISLTCLVMKIFEKNILNMLKCRHLLKENQHGFMSSKSCDTQMLYFQESLMLSQNNVIQNYIVDFDFSKAFDSVDHDILLMKLKRQA